jgi:hypothetical protein
MTTQNGGILSSTAPIQLCTLSTVGKCMRQHGDHQGIEKGAQMRAKMNDNRLLVYLCGGALILASVATAGTAETSAYASQGPTVQSAKPPETSVSPNKKTTMLFAQLPDGRLMGVYQRTVDGVQEMDARYSTDEGYTWSETETLFKLPKKKIFDPKREPWAFENILLDHDGELHIFFTLLYKVGEEKGARDMRYDVWHVRSTDGRKNWKAPNAVWQQGYAGDMLSVIQLRNGRILLPLCIMTTRTWNHPGTGLDAFTFMGTFSSQITYSDDDGETWSLSPTEFKEATPYIGADGGIEPTLLQLKDDRVWMLIRTQWGRYFEAFSKDGATWSALRPTHILSSDSPAALVRLKDGRIVMLWNQCLRYPYAQGGRHVLHAAISEDDAKTWRGYREVDRDPEAKDPHPPDGDYGVAYTIPAVTKGQKIIFSSNRFGPGGQAGDSDDWWFVVVHADPEWLYATQREDHFATELQDWSSFGTKGVQLTTHPEKPGAQVLQIEKPEPDWSGAAVWNFPMGRKGVLNLRLFLKPGFGGMRIGLTDHFSVPFEDLDGIYNVYSLEIQPTGKLAHGNIEPGQWHNVQFTWDCDKGEARVLSDGHPLAVLHQTRDTLGLNYLRLVSTADPSDNAGVLVESVDVDVSKGWK